MKTPKISIVIPFHWMKGWPSFMSRCLESIETQSFKDYEIILTYHGKMAENSNRAMGCANGEIVKVLYLDDMLAHPNALQEIADEFDKGAKWLITGCDTNNDPMVTADLVSGNNKLGSPSCLSFRRDCAMEFDEGMSWLLDCDLYERMIEAHGYPEILPGAHVLMGIGDHQVTNTMSDEEKEKEFTYITSKYEN